ncbi:hypothetical protein ACH5RR_035750 [Cinchona calisaya]|uniref:Uncharacterized protein n=1 Tax=Cinchona calisaya TaxID=153742 RepID=A0ABD2Y2Q1_9GENT
MAVRELGKRFAARAFYSAPPSPFGALSSPSLTPGEILLLRPLLLLGGAPHSPGLFLLSWILRPPLGEGCLPLVFFVLDVASYSQKISWALGFGRTPLED